MKIGIDLGGSHVAIGVVDDNGNIIENIVLNTPFWPNDSLLVIVFRPASFIKEVHDATW